MGLSSSKSPFWTTNCFRFSKMGLNSDKINLENPRKMISLSITKSLICWAKLEWKLSNHIMKRTRRSLSVLESCSCWHSALFVTLYTPYGIFLIFLMKFLAFIFTSQLQFTIWALSMILWESFPAPKDPWELYLLMASFCIRRVRFSSSSMISLINYKSRLTSTEPSLLAIFETDFNGAEGSVARGLMLPKSCSKLIGLMVFLAVFISPWEAFGDKLVLRLDKDVLNRFMTEFSSNCFLVAILSSINSITCCTPSVIMHFCFLSWFASLNFLIHGFSFDSAAEFYSSESSFCSESPLECLKPGEEASKLPIGEFLPSTPSDLSISGDFDLSIPGDNIF